MDIEARAAWIDRFVVDLSRYQLESSPDMLVDRAFARLWSLGDLPPEVAAQIEYSEFATAGVRSGG